MKKMLTVTTMASLLLSTINYADNTDTTKNVKKVTNNTTPNYITPTNTAVIINDPKENSALTGNFDITTNYMFRGISNSNNNPAVQGGFTYTFPIGLYFNIWGSNVDFLDHQGNTATVEFDTIAGIRHDVTENLSYDINIDRYNYPGATPAAYYEGIAVITYTIFSATIGYSSNVYNTHKEGTYVSGAINYDLPPKFKYADNVTLTASVGHYDLPRDAGLYSYNDFLIGITKSIGQYSLSIQWTDTSHSHQAELGDSHLIGTVLVNF